jgi:hypothetical protein
MALCPRPKGEQFDRLFVTLSSPMWNLSFEEVSQYEKALIAIHTAIDDGLEPRAEDRRLVSQLIGM